MTHEFRWLVLQGSGVEKRLQIRTQYPSGPPNGLGQAMLWSDWADIPAVVETAISLDFTEAEVAVFSGFLAQFKKSKEEVANWPDWMKASAVAATASFPKLGKK